MLRGGGIARCFGDSSSESGGDEERLSDDEVTVVRTVTTRPLMSLPAAAAEVKVEPVQSQTRRVAVPPEEYPRNLADLSQRDERWLLASLVRVGQRKKGCAGRPVSFRPQAKALFDSLVAARKAGALHAGSSSSSSTDRFKRKVDGDFSPLEDTGTPWKVQTAKGRRRKPADVEHTDIPAAQTTPLKHHTHFLGEAGGPCNSCSGSDAECIDVISSVTETPPAPNSDVDSRSARVATIPHSSSPSDGASPSPTGSPSSCPATSPVVSATHSALCSPSGSPSGSPRGSPGVREGVGAGGSPSVGADGGSPSGVNAGGSAGGSAMVSAGGGAVAVGAVEKKGTARSNRTSKKKNKKPEAAVKTAEVLALEAFEKSLQPNLPYMLSCLKHLHRGPTFPPTGAALPKS